MTSKYLLHGFVVLLVWCKFLLTAACTNGHSENRDAGSDLDGFDGSDAEAGSDAGGDELGEDEFGIMVPAGTLTCTLSGGRGAIREYQMKGRIRLRPGAVHLPRNEPFVGMDWVEAIELGPQRLSARSLGPGEFTREIEGTPDDGFYRYEFRQSFLAGQDPFDVVFRTSFEVQGGVAAEPTLLLDQDTLSVDPWNPWVYPSRFTLEGILDDGTGQWVQSYCTCNPDRFRQAAVEAGTGEGDTLSLQLWCPEWDPMLWSGCPCFLVRALFERDGEQREVQDHFRLAYSAGGQHCWRVSYLVVFDQPVDAIHGLLIEFDGMSSADPDEIQHLGADLEVTRVQAFTSWEWTWM